MTETKHSASGEKVFLDTYYSTRSTTPSVCTMGGNGGLYYSPGAFRIPLFVYVCVCVHTNDEPPGSGSFGNLQGFLSWKCSELQAEQDSRTLGKVQKGSGAACTHIICLFSAQGH